MSEKGNCRSCKAPILWCRTTLGNLMPVDAEPVADGNIVLKDGTAHTLSKADLFEPMVDGPRYRSHYATCPDAQKYRKKKGEGK